MQRWTRARVPRLACLGGTVWLAVLGTVWLAVLETVPPAAADESEAFRVATIHYRPALRDDVHAALELEDVTWLVRRKPHGEKGPAPSSARPPAVSCRPLLRALLEGFAATGFHAARIELTPVQQAARSPSLATHFDAVLDFTAPAAWSREALDSKLAAFGLICADRCGAEPEIQAIRRVPAAHLDEDAPRPWRLQATLARCAPDGFVERAPRTLSPGLHADLMARIAKMPSVRHVRGSPAMTVRSRLVTKPAGRIDSFELLHGGPVKERTSLPVHIDGIQKAADCTLQACRYEVTEGLAEPSSTSEYILSARYVRWTRGKIGDRAALRLRAGLDAWKARGSEGAAEPFEKVVVRLKSSHVAIADALEVPGLVEVTCSPSASGLRGIRDRPDYADLLATYVRHVREAGYRFERVQAKRSWLRTELISERRLDRPGAKAYNIEGELMYAWEALRVEPAIETRIWGAQVVTCFDESATGERLTDPWRLGVDASLRVEPLMAVRHGVDPARALAADAVQAAIEAKARAHDLEVSVVRTEAPEPWPYAGVSMGRYRVTSKAVGVDRLRSAPLDKFVAFLRAVEASAAIGVEAMLWDREAESASLDLRVRLR